VGPKIGEIRNKKLLEGDLKRNARWSRSKRCEYLSDVAGLAVSRSTVGRMLKRMGHTRKKIGGGHRTGRVLEGSLESIDCCKARDDQLGVRR
jgi:hypothetical protein